MSNDKAKEFLLLHEHRHTQQINKRGSRKKFIKEYKKDPFRFERDATEYALVKLGIVGSSKSRTSSKDEEIRLEYENERNIALEYYKEVNGTEENFKFPSFETYKQSFDDEVGSPKSYTSSNTAVTKKPAENMASTEEIETKVESLPSKDTTSSKKPKIKLYKEKYS
ncbi:MAG: hypothetical protein LRY48_00180 [Bacteroides graminisolvens]|nr:hypothetical protein [Bacteroides graminisolvens]